MRLILAGVLTVFACALAPPAGATAPGQNGGKIAFASGGDIYVMNPDGSGVVNLTNTPFLEHDENHPAWSPDGTQIAFDDRPDDDATFQSIETINADGTARASVGGWFDNSIFPDWSPGGEEIAFRSCQGHETEFPQCVVAARKPDGSAPRQVVGDDATSPSWSPDGKRIAFIRQGDVYVANSNGTNITPVSVTPTAEFQPDWSPDGARIVFFSSRDGNYDVYSIRPDGTDLARLTNHPGFDLFPSWSPDGTKILFDSDRDVSGGMYSMNPDGSDVARIGTATGSGPVWQPIPVNAYPRPKGASPTRVSLVPAYEPCTSPDRTHGPPLAFPSCSPPTQAPGELTVGTPDANGQPAKSVSHVRINPVRGLPSTPADEADVRLRGTIDDVRLASDLSDYTGDLELRLTVQITDKDNTPHPGGPGPATVQQFTHSHPLPCAATADTTVGSTCAFDTTVEALVPGAVKELQRAIWELDQVRVHDGAGDLFLTQGVFIP